jgi:hypothetical protein
MVVQYTFFEHANMHLVLDECEGNPTAAVRRFAEKYLKGRVLNNRTSLFDYQRIREIRILHILVGDVGCSRSWGRK